MTEADYGVVMSAVESDDYREIESAVEAFMNERFRYEDATLSASPHAATIEISHPAQTDGELFLTASFHVLDDEEGVSKATVATVKTEDTRVEAEVTACDELWAQLNRTFYGSGMENIEAALEDFLTE